MMRALPDPRERPLLTVTEVAETLPDGVGEKGVRAGIAAGQIPHIRLGRRVLVPTAPFMRDVLGIDPEGETPAPALRLVEPDGGPGAA